MMNFEIPGPFDGERVDRVLAATFEVSRSVAHRAVDDGKVSLNGKVVTRSSQRVTTGDSLALDEALAPVEAPLPEADSSVVFSVVHDDESVVVVDKPAELVVHPGAGHQSGTLVNGLLARYPDIAAVGGEQRPGIVHRLDADTSGLMVVARTAQAYDHLVEAIAQRQVTRRYVSLAFGLFEHDKGTIDAPIGRSRREPTRMTVRKDGKEAITHYEVAQRFERHTLVGCRLETGRTHQIRVHLAAIGHPVGGDHRYGGHQIEGLRRHFLHASMLDFEHPMTGDRVAFESALPADLQGVLDTNSSI
jgi:23S rRNA pseudouridine1911/1915/1917 synthase